MFISVKRHEREKQALAGANSRFTDAILKYTDQGMFMLDGRDRILPQVSRSLGLMFRRQEFSNLSFEKLLAPVVSVKTLTLVRIHMEVLLNDTQTDSEPGSHALKDIEVRLTNADGSIDTAHYWFDFDPIDLPNEPRNWLVRVTDITTQVESLRELEELRGQTQAQGEILRGVLQMGGARFGTFLQKADASMKTIGTVLKKSARAETAFRSKLEETLDEVDRIRREAAAFKLSALQHAAREFEDALHELRSRSALSGSDFLPLAVKLDHLYAQFAMVKSFTMAAATRTNDSEPAARVTEKGTLIMEAPKFIAEAELKAASVDALLSAAPTAVVPEQVASPGEASPGVASPGDATSDEASLSMAPAPKAASPLPRAPRPAAAGTLESTLSALTDHVAQETNKEVVLETHGIHLVPVKYASTVKNVAIQLIRNAVVHGIETPVERESAGKSLNGTLRLDFKLTEDGFELLFEDDGCGLDPVRMREVAVERGIVTADAAANMRDREAIKLIFKSRFTTLADTSGERSHGAGMSLVRRYVHEAGGKIALASLPGLDTRFKISLPAVAAEPHPGLIDGEAPAGDSKVA
jgi:two-component system chemotaxis sensor kinase CheA